MPKIRPGFVLLTTFGTVLAALIVWFCVLYVTQPEPKPHQDYAAANRRQLASGARPNVIFIGDSITERWPRLGASSWRPEWLNRGLGGERSDHVRARFAEDVVKLRPQVVVILIGTNDAWVSSAALPLVMTEANIAAMVTLAHEAGIRVVLASVPPVSHVTDPTLPPMPANAEPRIEAENIWLKAYAAGHGAGFADYWSVMRPQFTSDGVHPNADGYARMAAAAADAIRETLRSPAR